MHQRFKDRREAGKVLASLLRHLVGQRVLVLALPRGGVPVGFEVASRLGAPLDVLVVRKLGVPGHEEVAMGAVASGGGVVLNREVLDVMRVGAQTIREVTHLELNELWRREALYRAGQPALDIEGSSVVLVDDGLATGATMRAAAATVRLARPRRVIVAVPVAAPEAQRRLSRIADEVCCMETPRQFLAVSQSYEDFSQTSDAEVRMLLAAQRQTLGVEAYDAVS